MLAKNPPLEARDSLAQLRAVFTSARVDPGVVKVAVCAYVDDMKKLGAPVERVIVDIKRIAEAWDGPLIAARQRKDAEQYDSAKRLLDNAIQWCIEHYYGAAS